MALAFEVASDEFTFDTFQPGEGQPPHVHNVSFGENRVQNAWAILQGFDLHYQGSHDHHVLRESVNLYTGISLSSLGTVDVTIEILLRDGSGNIDDPYAGKITFLVIADLA